MKTCSECKQEKALSEFYNTDAFKKYKFGVDFKCKSCRNGYNLRVSRTSGKFTCTVDQCDRRHYAKGYCRLHYDRVRDYGRTDILKEVLPLDQEKQFYRTINGKVYKGNLYSLESRIWHKYKMTVEQWTALAENGCNICGAATGTASDRHLHVDHDHACCPGKTSCGECVRGIVCNSCNTAIGRYEKGTLRDDYPKRDGIIKYLQDYTARRKKLDNIKTLHDVFVDPQGKYKEW
jgi:hypothetical protein